MRENDIIIACSSGIYEMEYGEDEFQKVVDCDADQVFCLQDEDLAFNQYIYKNDRGEYVLNRYSKNPESNEDKLCVYLP